MISASCAEKMAFIVAMYWAEVSWEAVTASMRGFVDLSPHVRNCFWRCRKQMDLDKAADNAGVLGAPSTNSNSVHKGSI